MSALELAHCHALEHFGNIDTAGSEISFGRVSDFTSEQLECYSTTDVSDGWCLADGCDKNGVPDDALDVNGLKLDAGQVDSLYKTVAVAPSAGPNRIQLLRLHNKMAQSVMNPPTRVEYNKMKFLILDAPSNENLLGYIKEMKNYGVTDLVRTCENTYDDSIVAAAGIRVHEMVFPDGEAPAENIILQWMAVVAKTVVENGAVAVHCVAGLGRAPVLVAIALIECGMGPMDAILYVRERRKGAINRRQLQFLRVYKSRLPKKKWCIKKCTIM